MNSPNNLQDILGKKIFFLHPSTVVQNQIIAELVQQEYEVYIAKDPAALVKVLKRYPDSIVFADIDEGMPEKGWESWIREVMGGPETGRVGIGVISANGDENLQRKYVNSVKVHCGYTLLKSDLVNSVKYLLEILKAAEAKGRRKYIRATTENETLTTVNFPLNGTFVNGTIRDISAVGFSCSFAEDPDLAKNTLFQNVQIKLQSTILKVEGIVFGSRMDGTGKTYVVLFTQRIDPDARTRIRTYIQQNLQAKMNAELRQ
jgi:hypothetical protein